MRSVDPDKGTTTTDSTTPATSSPPPTAAASPSPTPTTRSAQDDLRDTSTTGPKRAEWVYDTLANGTSVKGQLVKTIRYVGTDQYIKEHVGYTVDYKPTERQVHGPVGRDRPERLLHLRLHLPPGRLPGDHPAAGRRRPRAGDADPRVQRGGQADRAEDHARCAPTSPAPTTPASARSARCTCATTPAAWPTSSRPTRPTPAGCDQIWTTTADRDRRGGRRALQLRPGRQRHQDRRPHRRRHPVLQHRLPAAGSPRPGPRPTATATPTRHDGARRPGPVLALLRLRRLRHPHRARRARHGHR